MMGRRWKAVTVNIGPTIQNSTESESREQLISTTIISLDQPQHWALLEVRGVRYPQTWLLIGWFFDTS